jgi:hypothetical protein
VIPVPGSNAAATKTGLEADHVARIRAAPLPAVLTGALTTGSIALSVGANSDTIGRDFEPAPPRSVIAKASRLCTADGLTLANSQTPLDRIL